MHPATQARALHSNLVVAADALRSCEHRLAQLLAEATRAYAHLGFASLVAYAAEALKLPARKAWLLARIGKKLPTLPALDEALAAGRLAWTKARELLAVVTPWGSRPDAHLEADASPHRSFGAGCLPPPGLPG